MLSVVLLASASLKIFHYSRPVELSVAMQSTQQEIKFKMKSDWADHGRASQAERNHAPASEDESLYNGEPC